MSVKREKDERKGEGFGSVWICFCTTSRLHFHYTLSYKRKINIIGKGHFEIGIATYFWLAKLMNPNDNIHSTAFHALTEVRSLVYLFAFDRYSKARYLNFMVSKPKQTETNGKRGRDSKA